jgi:hypothetical protein
LTTYGPDGTQLAQWASSGPNAFTAACGDDVVHTPDHRDTVLTLALVETPAAGLTPASWAVSARVTDGLTGTTIWTKSIVASASSAVCGERSDEFQLRGHTSDGAYEWLHAADHDYVLDVASGGLREQQDLQAIADRDIVTWIEPISGPTTNDTIRSPRDGATVAPLKDSAIADWLACPDLAGVCGGSDQLVAGNGVLVGAYYLDPSDTACGGKSLEALSLTTGAPLWRAPNPPGGGAHFLHDVAIDPSDHQVIAATGLDPVCGGSPDIVIAYDTTTGKVQWKVDADGLCGAADGHALVTANGQSVVVDSAGHQVSYSNGDTCPTMLPNGFTATTDSNGVTTITKTL